MFLNILLGFMIFMMDNVKSMYLPCVSYNESCYYQPCCEPYICYEQTACIERNNITNI